MLTSVRRSEFRYARRVVIKAGTGVVSTPDGYLAIGRIGNLVQQIWGLIKSGKEVVLVTSGAVGLGKLKLNKQAQLSASLRTHLGLKGNQVSWDDKASAAAGQSVLMSIYESLFGQFDVQVSQVLLMDDDFLNQQKRSSFRSTMEILLKVGVLPILNENDVMTSRTLPLVDENKAIFWDNDSLACLVASEIQADLVILLSDVDGLYKQMPQEGEEPDVISTFHVAEKVTLGTKSRVGRGGMQAKIDAALSAVRKGVKAVVVASGFKNDTISDVVSGKDVGTLFAPQSFHSVKLGEEEHAGPGTPVRKAMNARSASRALQSASPEVRSKILFAIADSLIENSDNILNVNREDVDNAKKSQAADTLISRLLLTKNKLETLATGIRKVASSPDPIGRTVSRMELSPGLVLEKKTTAIGVLLIIFESRPDALPQIAALSIRSGNGLLIKGGKEAQRTNAYIHKLIVQSVYNTSNGSVPRDLVGLVETREGVKELLHLDAHIDLIIPRGSSRLVSYLQKHSKIPVLGHADGICHMYLDRTADMNKAIRLVIDAKTDYPSACNALETLLLHSSILDSRRFQELMKRLSDSKVTIFGGPNACAKLNLTPCPSLSHEYGALQMTLEIVDSVDEAIAHINTYGSHHTDCIVAEDIDAARKFLDQVDSACVFHNASTRFADGYRFGLGAEVGISTGRIHARGPVGVEGLLTTKWVLVSEDKDAHCVSDFASGRCVYSHKLVSHL